MPIPNAITRTIELAHPQEEVWAALTTIEGITGWFGSRAEGRIAPGHDVRMRWEQEGADGVLSIKVVEPMKVFGFCWGITDAPAGDPRRTYVEFVLEPIASGTRVTVTESGFAQLPDAWLESSYLGNVEGWDSELADLVAYLDAA